MCAPDDCSPRNTTPPTRKRSGRDSSRRRLVWFLALVLVFTILRVRTVLTRDFGAVVPAFVDVVAAVVSASYSGSRSGGAGGATLLPQEDQRGGNDRPPTARGTPPPRNGGPRTAPAQEYRRDAAGETPAPNRHRDGANGSDTSLREEHPQGSKNGTSAQDVPADHDGKTAVPVEADHREAGKAPAPTTNPGGTDLLVDQRKEANESSTQDILANNDDMKAASIVRYRLEMRKTTTLNLTAPPSNCMPYKCRTNVTECDNVLPTDYDGPRPPCCVHVLRDMARAFDEAMHGDLSLDYCAAFGTLLGLQRADRLIPWTADNDYIVPSVRAARAMKSKWNTTKTGLSFVFQDIDRMCVTKDFRNGALQKWEMPGWRCDNELLDRCVFPYIDLYVGKNATRGRFAGFPDWGYRYEDVFPTQRRMVYGGTFWQNFPARPDRMLLANYGTNWSVPLASKSPHAHVSGIQLDLIRRYEQEVAKSEPV